MRTEGTGHLKTYQGPHWESKPELQYGIEFRCSPKQRTDGVFSKQEFGKFFCV